MEGGAVGGDLSRRRGVTEFDGRLKGLDVIGVHDRSVCCQTSSGSEVTGSAAVTGTAIAGSMEIYIGTNSKILCRRRRVGIVRRTTSSSR